MERTVSISNHSYIRLRIHSTNVWNMQHDNIIWEPWWTWRWRSYSRCLKQLVVNVKHGIERSIVQSNINVAKYNVYMIVNFNQIISNTERKILIMSKRDGRETINSSICLGEIYSKYWFVSYFPWVFRVRELSIVVPSSLHFQGEKCLYYFENCSWLQIQIRSSSICGECGKNNASS